MSDVLDRVRGEIRQRLEQSRDAVREYEQLEAALAALEGIRATSAAAPSAASAAAEPPARRSTPAKAPRAPRKRAARGANRAALLQAVAERPGASVGVLASASGIARPTLYALLATLTERGELVKRELPGGGSGYARAAPIDGAGRSARRWRERAADAPTATPAGDGEPVVRRTGDQRCSGRTCRGPWSCRSTDSSLTRW